MEHCLNPETISSLLADGIKTGLGALLGTLAGAQIAHRLQQDEKLAEEKAMVLRRVELIRESLAQIVVQIDNVIAEAKKGQSAGLRIRFPDDYYKDLPFDLILKHLGREHVDNIKNITRVVIPRWNELAGSENRNDTEVVSNLCQLAYRETLQACRKVIKALEDKVPEIGKTTVPGYKEK